MNILITNDDGIWAEGIAVLKKYLENSGHEVLVSAPDVERSATGHAITLRKPIWVKEIIKEGKLFGYATTGTPADCVKLGLRQLATKKIDLVVSGINRGANLGTDIPYSGTVSGAMEAAILGYPAIAISSQKHDDPCFDTAGRFLCDFIAKFDMQIVPDYGAININVPSIPYEDLKGYKITRQSTRRFDDYYEQRKDPYGNSYYWLMGTYLEEELTPDSDIYAVLNNYASVTPLTLFMTDDKLYEELKKENL